MNPKLIDTVSGVLQAAMAQGNREAYSLAVVLDCAGLLQSPETAAELEQLQEQVVRLSEQSPRVRTDGLQPGDRVWHPYDMTLFTVSAVPEELVQHLGFHNRETDGWESGMRVTGADDRGNAVHVDTAPSYMWHRADAATQLEQLRARVAELEAQRERRRDRLVALQNDALNMRGALAPNGEERKVPMPLGDTLTPAVEWLINRVAELEAERNAVLALHQPYPDSAHCVIDDEAWPCMTRSAVPTPAQQSEDPHDSPLHHEYRHGRDLDEQPTVCGCGHTALAHRPDGCIADAIHSGLIGLCGCTAEVTAL
ncbi:hypothetical protein [Streptomyces sp. NBC_00842]|uniref:hypothetical protein n=1 Tax=Streptomyces sp. NBC_00842 TaxID=2975848 RepID=UPI00386CFAFB|nr:terminase small subunit [Streptomyces sp. NBC_00842]